MTHSSPSRTAVVFSDDRSDPTPARSSRFPRSPRPRGSRAVRARWTGVPCSWMVNGVHRGADRAHRPGTVPRAAQPGEHILARASELRRPGEPQPAGGDRSRGRTRRRGAVRGRSARRARPCGFPTSGRRASPDLAAERLGHRAEIIGRELAGPGGGAAVGEVAASVSSAARLPPKRTASRWISRKCRGASCSSEYPIPPNVWCTSRMTRRNASAANTSAAAARNCQVAWPESRAAAAPSNDSREPGSAIWQLASLCCIA